MGGSNPLEQNKPQRESIWSVPRAAQAWYFGLFGIQIGVGVPFLLVRAAFESDNLSDYAVKSWSYIAPLAITSAAMSLFLVEAWGFISFLGAAIRRLFMVLGEYLREKFNLHRKDREAKESSDVTTDHSVDRPPRAFSSPPPGRVKPVENFEETED